MDKVGKNSIFNIKDIHSEIEFEKIKLNKK